MNLDKNLSIFFEQRFAQLDRAFVRFIELQNEFLQLSIQALAPCQNFVENYRSDIWREREREEERKGVHVREKILCSILLSFLLAHHNSIIYSLNCNLSY